MQRKLIRTCVQHLILKSQLKHSVWHAFNGITHFSSNILLKLTETVIKNLLRNHGHFLPWHFGVYQTPLSEECCLRLLLPVHGFRCSGKILPWCEMVAVVISKRKGKERKSIYIAPFYYTVRKALRHGSHSFTCKYTMTCLLYTSDAADE